MNNQNEQTENLANLADDFFLCIIRTLSQFEIFQESMLLPHLHSHCLELSLKAYLLKYQSEIPHTHKIDSLVKMLYNYDKQFDKGLLPSKLDYDSLKKIEDKEDFSIIDLNNWNIHPQLLDKAILAYYIKYNENLKYLITNSGQIIIQKAGHNGLNAPFLEIFRSSRKLYANKKLNDRFVKILYSQFLVMGKSKAEIDNYFDNQLMLFVR